MIKDLEARNKARFEDDKLAWELESAISRFILHATTQDGNQFSNILKKLEHMLLKKEKVESIGIAIRKRSLSLFYYHLPENVL